MDSKSKGLGFESHCQLPFGGRQSVPYVDSYIIFKLTPEEDQSGHQQSPD